MSVWKTSVNWDQPLSRRAVLRGAGAVLALPFLESWATALTGKAPVKPPMRMGICTVTGGTVLESWRAKEGRSLGRLPSILRPLEFAKKDLLLLTGLSHSGPGDNLNAHEYCGFKHLTAAPKVGKVGGKVFASVSVDQAAARVLGEDTFLPSLEFGLSNHETRYSF